MCICLRTRTERTSKSGIQVLQLPVPPQVVEPSVVHEEQGVRWTGSNVDHFATHAAMASVMEVTLVAITCVFKVCLCKTGIDIGLGSLCKLVEVEVAGNAV